MTYLSGFGLISSTMNPNDLLTTQETCRILKIARQTLYIWIEQGKIKPWRKLGGRAAWFFFKKEVLKAKRKKYERINA